MKIDLDHIYTICDNDREFVGDMLATFVRITPVSIDDLNDSFENKNWLQVSKAAHKIKPSVLMLGIDQFSALIKEIELLAKDPKDTNELATKISLFNQHSVEVLTDIEDLLASKRY